jgi:hypothetical protein
MFQSSNTGLFGSANSQQQFPDNFGAQQQQSSFGLGSGGASGYGAYQQQPNPQNCCAKNITSTRLCWVKASGGAIPDHAIECFRLGSAHVPCYVARFESKHERSPSSSFGGGKGQSGYAYGYIQSGGKVISSSSNSTNPNYEVLVNPDDSEDLSWVFTATGFRNCFNSRSTCLPYNSLQISTNNTGCTFIGRTRKTTDNEHVLVTININGYALTKESSIFPDYEVLCVLDSEGEHLIHKSYLYNIEYDLENASVEWNQTLLDELVLTNESSVEQKLKPLAKVSLPTTFQWDISNDKYSQAEMDIKGRVPCVIGGQYSYKIDLLTRENIMLYLPTIPATTGGLFGNSYSNALVIGGNFETNIPAVTQLVNFSVNSGIFAPTVIMMKSQDRAISHVSSLSAGCKIRVPLHQSKLLVQLIKHHMCLKVPYKAKLKYIFGTSKVEDEEVKGTYIHTSVTAVVPTVV